VELFFCVCVLNRTLVYLHSFVYVIDHLRTVIFILATVTNTTSAASNRVSWLQGGIRVRVSRVRV